MKVLFWPEPPENLMGMVQEACPDDIELVFLPRDASENEMLARLQEVEVLLCLGAAKFTPAIYEALGKVKLTQLMSAGYDFLDIDALRANHVVACTNGGANANAVAEHAVLLMLAVLRRITVLDASVRAGTWVRDITANHELTGRTVGLLGLGFIGRQVAQRLQGFEVELIYHDIERASEAVESQLNIAYRSLSQLVSESDVLSLHAALNEATNGIINKQTLSAMKPGAILINTARGELVDEPALLDALKNGRIMGAGLDVFSVDPPPPDHPLLAPGLRVVATPHDAGPTWESYPRRFKNAFSNAQRVQRGELPLWLIAELRG